MTFVLAPVKRKRAFFDGLASARCQPLNRTTQGLFQFGLIGLLGLCTAVQWPSAVKADPWTDHRHCLTISRWGRPLLVCEQESRDRRWEEGRPWQDSRWDREQSWGSDPDWNEAWRWNRAQRWGANRDWNPSRWNPNQRWSSDRPWHDSRWGREATSGSEPDWTNSRWILYP